MSVLDTDKAAAPSGFAASIAQGLAAEACRSGEHSRRLNSRALYF